MRLPIDNEVMPSHDEDLEDSHELDARIQRILAVREKAFGEAEANIMSAQKTQKETYDRKRQPQVLAEGTEVLLENTAQKQRKGGKMVPLWLGPYIINRNVGKGLYELCDMTGKVIKKKANINRLKIFMRRDDGPAHSKVAPGSPAKPPPEKKRKVRYPSFMHLINVC